MDMLIGKAVYVLQILSSIYYAIFNCFCNILNVSKSNV